MTLGAYDALFLTAVTAIASVAGPLVSQHILSRFAQHSETESLKAALRISGDENRQLKTQIADLQSQNSQLQSQYDASFSDAAIRAKYEFDKTTGAFTPIPADDPLDEDGQHTPEGHVQHDQQRQQRHRNNDRFCNPCLHKSPPVEANLVFDCQVWKCRNCGTFHSPTSA